MRTLMISRVPAAQHFHRNLVETLVSPWYDSDFQ